MASRHPNRRAIQENIKRMVANASCTVSPPSALMIDLDHFKQINDKYGHDRGDEVLAGVGVALEAALRASDFAGRWGGEEFILLLSNTTVEGAVVVAEKVRQAISEIYVPAVDRLISASIGIATIPDHAWMPSTSSAAPIAPSIPPRGTVATASRSPLRKRRWIEPRLVQR
jgi:diguanylate cyclase (GGDEF)-like protein